MNNVALIALIWLGCSLLFLALKVFLYVREQWLIVDRETKAEMERQKSQDEKMKEMDYLLTQIFIDENNKEAAEKIDQE